MLTWGSGEALAFSLVLCVCPRGSCGVPAGMHGAGVAHVASAQGLCHLLPSECLFMPSSLSFAGCGTLGFAKECTGLTLISLWSLLESDKICGTSVLECRDA